MKITHEAQPDALYIELRPLAPGTVEFGNGTTTSPPITAPTVGSRGWESSTLPSSWATNSNAWSWRSPRS